MVRKATYNVVVNRPERYSWIAIVLALAWPFDIASASARQLSPVALHRSWSPKYPEVLAAGLIGMVLSYSGFP